MPEPDGNVPADDDGVVRRPHGRRRRVGSVLVDNGSPQLLNLGDIAMLQATVGRLREAFPEATVKVVTTSPERLAKFCGPAAVPVSPDGRDLLCRIDTEFGAAGLDRTPPPAGPADLSPFIRLLRERFPRGDVWWSTRRMRRFGHDADAAGRFWRAVRTADLVVAAGGGYLNDVFPWVATDVLGTLRLAQRVGIPTALMGQGMGPLADDGTVRRLAAATLAAAGLVGLRERRASAPLVAELGVDPRRVVVTGDDAVERAMADADPLARAADGIGVNVRVADYANVDASSLEPLRTAVHRAAGRLGAGLVPLPVARHQFDDDCAALRHVLTRPSGGPGAVDGGPVDAGEGIATPADLARQVTRCRVVVTGSYHAAVFALAQGRPVVAVTRSRYYDDKFAGLADLYGHGVWVVPGGEGSRDLAGTLAAAIGQAWRAADALREPLVQQSRLMAAAGRRAYGRLSEAVAGS